MNQIIPSTFMSMDGDFEKIEQINCSVPLHISSLLVTVQYNPHPKVNVLFLKYPWPSLHIDDKEK